MSRLENYREHSIEALDEEALRELAESDRESAWVYQKVLERTQEIQEERSE